MTQIASAPFNEHYFKINGFNDLSSFVDQISAKSCDGEFYYPLSFVEFL